MSMRALPFTVMAAVLGYYCYAQVSPLGISVPSVLHTVQTQQKHNACLEELTLLLGLSRNMFSTSVCCLLWMARIAISNIIRAGDGRGRGKSLCTHFHLLLNLPYVSCVHFHWTFTQLYSTCIDFHIGQIWMCIEKKKFQKKMSYQKFTLKQYNLYDQSQLSDRPAGFRFKLSMMNYRVK